MGYENPVYMRMLACDLSELRARFDARLQQFQLLRGALTFSHVRVLGVCTNIVRSEQTCELELDDGTDVVQVRIDPSKLLSDPTELRVGELIDCLGVLAETPAQSSKAAQRWVVASQVTLVQDHNTESLRMLEILQLHRSTTAAHPHRPTAVLPLLPIPTAPAAAVKRKRAALALGVKTAQSSTTLIEKPLQQVSMQQPRVATNAHSAAAVPARVSAVPAAEYRFNVSETDQQLIASGVKTLEIRLNVPPYAIIRVDDRIVINGHTTATVSAVRKYSHLRAVLATEPLDKLLPTAASAAETLNAAAAAEQRLRQFLSATEEAAHGLVIFELRVASRAPPAGAAAVVPQQSLQDWSKRLYEQLEKNRKFGCSLGDLQFAFPALPVAQLQDMLTDLQLEGVVYAVQDKYLLL